MFVCLNKSLIGYDVAQPSLTLFVHWLVCYALAMVAAICILKAASASEPSAWICPAMSRVVQIDALDMCPGAEHLGLMSEPCPTDCFTKHCLWKLSVVAWQAEGSYLVAICEMPHVWMSWMDLGMQAQEGGSY